MLDNPASPAEIISGFQALRSDGSVMTGTIPMRMGTIVSDAIVNSNNKVPIRHNLGVKPKFIMIWTTESLKNVTDIVWPIYWGCAACLAGADSYNKSVIAYYNTTDNTIDHSSSNAVTLLVTGIEENQFLWISYPNPNYGWPAGVTYNWMVIG